MHRSLPYGDFVKRVMSDAHITGSSFVVLFIIVVVYFVVCLFLLFLVSLCVILVCFCIFLPVFTAVCCFLFVLGEGEWP